VIELFGDELILGLDWQINQSINEWIDDIWNSILLTEINGNNCPHEQFLKRYTVFVIVFFNICGS